MRLTSAVQCSEVTLNSPVGFSVERRRISPSGPVQCRCLSTICMMQHRLKTFRPISGFLFSDNFSQRIKYLSVGTHCHKHQQNTVLL